METPKIAETERFSNFPMDRPWSISLPVAILLLSIMHQSIAIPMSLCKWRYNLVMDSEHMIGQGSFGTVYRAFDRLTGESVAIKVCKPPEEILEQCRHEFHVLYNQLYGAPGIIQVRDSFDRNGSFNIVSRLMTRHLAISDAADWSQFKRIIREILLALQSLTERGVVHCDLKRNNILIHEPSGAIALADFGPSRNATDEHDQIERTTLPYQAPEVFLWNHYSHASDIWAVGCIFMELFFGKILFRPKHMLDWNQASTLIPQLWLNNLGPPPDWLADALRFYPVDRQKARHGLRDSLNDEPLFNNFIHGFFRWHPKERTTVEQALKHPFFASSDSEIVSR